MNHFVKIHCWGEIPGQNRSKLWIAFLFIITFVKNIKFHHFRGSFWVISQACMFQKCCNMNHIAKIYCWAEISAQNKLQFSFTFGFKVVFVKKVIFYISGGLFWDSTEALIFHGGFSMCHSGKIQSWSRLLGKKGYAYQFFTIL